MNTYKYDKLWKSFIFLGNKFSSFSLKYETFLYSHVLIWDVAMLYLVIEVNICCPLHSKEIKEYVCFLDSPLEACL